MHQTGGKRFIGGIRKLLAGSILLLFLFSGNDQLNQLEQVMQRGSLTMLTRNGASSYYLGPEGDTGPEYELVKNFSDYLGVDLDIRVAPAFNQLSVLLNQGQGDLIAANLTRTPSRELVFNFGPDYLDTAILVVYRRGKIRPKNIADLQGRKIMVIAGSSYEEALASASEQHPGLEWEPRSDVGIEELLLAVADGAIDYTLIDSSIYSLNTHFYPKVAKAFALPGTLPHAWAFPAGSDHSLLQQAQTFIEQATHNGQLQAINEAFYQPRARLDRVGMFQFLEQVRERLPPLLPVFQDVASAHDMDWRLLAAIGYQESHWIPDASSYTGVRGIMMLTRRTAKQLGLTDRLDPEQSIEGGARYFLQLRSRIPDRIQEPDRTWLALAAYNMGMSHLEDARVLTQKRGGNPDSWNDVNMNLELLSQEKWYRDLRFGYARGFEAKQYVKNIRSYYDILIWMETREHPLLVAQADTR
ncbi:membrane-bound lytic murein transglycosylase MltF [Pseudomonadota bacterium]